ncbi:MAG: guanylate kinase [Gemmatales bacterium]|nr:MAG: guanylate kinase [Gemmatales bacterium]
MAGRKGPLFIVSGPSGSGKSTALRRLLSQTNLPLKLAVSATTRPPRPGELDGVDYYFWSRDRFERELAKDSFLEWAEVFGNYYGTLRSEVEPAREQGQGVILEIDVNGARQVRQRCPDAVSIFLRAPSLETYKERLEARGTENEETIQRRLARIQTELQCASEYDYQVINDDLQATVDRLAEMVQQGFERRNHA